MLQPLTRTICSLALYLISLPLLATAVDPIPDPAAPPAITELTIPSNGQRMPALMYLANGPGPHPTVLLLHGFPGNEKNLDIAQDLRRNGFNVLFFHYRGAWGADGEYSILGAVDDVAAALEYIRTPANASELRIDTRKLSLLGHSMGGFSALAAGSRDTALVCVGALAPINIGVVKMGIDTENKNSLRVLKYADSLFMLSGYSSQKMLQELRNADLTTVDTRAFGPGLKGKSVLMITGDKDPVTPADTMMLPIAREYEKVATLKIEHYVISGDHSFSWSRLALTDLVRSWMLRECL